MTQYFIEVSETDTNYQNYIEIERRLNAEFGYPSTSTKTTRICDRWVKSSTPSSLITIEGVHWTQAQNVLTGPEIASAVTTKPSGYVRSPIQDNVAKHCLEVPHNATKCIILDGDSILNSANGGPALSDPDRVDSKIKAGLEVGNTVVLEAGAGGRTLATLESEFDTKLGNINFPSGCQVYYVVFAGTNDITNDLVLPSTAVTRLETLLGSASTNWTNNTLTTVLVTPIARLDMATTALLSTFRTLAMASEVPDYFIDLNNLTDFTLTDYTNVDDTNNYYTDKEHPTAAGATTIANYIITQLQGII